MPVLPSSTGPSPVESVLKLLDAHLVSVEQTRRAVSLLAAGNAFESWLAFETRLLAENNRNDLGLAERYDRPDGTACARYWMANEWRKVDFAIGDTLARDDSTLLAAFEFKLIHNNKNWKSKADEVWDDLFPTRSEKTGLSPIWGRVAVVGVIGKVYRAEDKGQYLGQIDDLSTWEAALESYLLPVDGWEGQRIQRLWRGRRYRIEHDWLQPEVQHFFELQAFVSS